MFATGSWRGAAIAGAAALVLALCGLPFFAISPVASFLWMTSMVLVVYRAVWQIRTTNREATSPGEKLHSLQDLYDEDARGATTFRVAKEDPNQVRSAADRELA
jgi:hypothetical protein